MWSESTCYTWFLPSGRRSRALVGKLCANDVHDSIGIYVFMWGSFRWLALVNTWTNGVRQTTRKWSVISLLTGATCRWSSRLSGVPLEMDARWDRCPQHAGCWHLIRPFEFNYIHKFPRINYAPARVPRAYFQLHKIFTPNKLQINLKYTASANSTQITQRLCALLTLMSPQHHPNQSSHYANARARTSKVFQHSYNAHKSRIDAVDHGDSVFLRVCECECWSARKT